jgi:amidase
MSAIPLAAGVPAGQDVCLLTASEMAALVRAGMISARELLAAHIRRIEAVNPSVNAVVTLATEQAMEAAKQADEQQARDKSSLGPLHGLPALHKDLVDTKGIRTTYGSPLFRDHVPAADAPIVQRMKRAGAITLGKTNTPEFGAGSQTFNTVFGTTKNPWNLSKTCGGSSGGAAVSLACRMIPVADGSDTGGSLRNPAAFCNIVGFRVSPGRVPNPEAAFAWSTLSTAGPMGRTVSDVALFLSAIAGPDPRSPLSLPESGEAFRRPLERDFKGVRIAWFKDLNGVPFDPQVRTVVDGHVKTFEALGCRVEQAEPNFDGSEFAFRTLRAWNSAHAHGEQLRAHREAYKDTLRQEVEEGLRLTGEDVAQAETLHGQVWRRFQVFLQKYDYFVLPTTQLPPFDHTLPYPTSVNGVPVVNYIDWMKSCWYISTAANPAISVPAGFTEDGLPVGLQIVGRWNADWSVLQLAHAFEQATGFGKRAPTVG